MSRLSLPERYLARGVLGQGGTARVTRVFDTALGREVALKVVGSAETVWLRREFNVLRQIRHENLVQVFDWGVLPDRNPYYTMEIVDGPGLASMIGSSVERDLLLNVLAGILRGIGHLHSHGEVHGDLKPSNVLLGANGTVKVADVGMGSVAGSSPSGSGTPGYTAPEVWAGEPVSERSDVYSVGVIAYEAFTGVHPFARRTVREVISSQVEGWVPSPGAQGIRLPADIERSLMRALERDPSLRQASADEVMEGMGLGDNTGEILGGKFVNRVEELRRLHEIVAREDSRKPTLLYLVGPAGVGKTALIEEAAVAYGFECRAIGGEPQNADSNSPYREAVLPAGSAVQAHGETTSATPVSPPQGAHPPYIMLVEDNAPPGADTSRSVARYIWAEAIERDEPASTLIVKNVATAPSALEPFEIALQVAPLPLHDIEDLIRGLLGRLQSEPNFVERLHLETGGLPGAIVGAVLELVDKHLLWRRSGEWRIGEIAEEDWAQLKSAKSRRSRDWDRLTEHEKNVLTAVALIDAELDVVSLNEILPGGDNVGAIAHLSSYALVRATGPHFLLASRDIGRVALGSANAARMNDIREAIIERIGPKLQRATRARLLLEGAATHEVIDEGLWLGNYCLSEGQYVAAIRAFLKTRDSARGAERLELARLASLNAADVLHRAGSLREAADVLGDSREWSDGPIGSGLAGPRAMLLGVLAKGLGDIQTAKAHFAECSEISRDVSPKLWLQAESELAELQWRHGGQPGRDAAAKRIEELMLHQDGLRELRDEWAALMYQRGAALVVEGKREAAIPILTGALELAKSEYWLMRVNNALAAAHFYLGNMRAGLEAADAAWEFAVKGGFDSFKPRVLMSRGTLKAGLGQYRDSAEQNVMAASWGRRVGNPFDVEAALISAVADLYTLADYERAIAFAQETREIALKIPNGRDVSKSLELEGLVNLHLGDYSKASELFAQARESLEGRGFDDLVPRLLWHEGRVHLELEQYREAEEKFIDALAILETTKDFEDLPGVQVEMQVLFSRGGDQRLNLEELCRLLDDAQRRELGTVRLRAAVALGEVAVTNLKDPRQVLAPLMEELRFAEGAGADEFVWRLNFWISRILRDKDPRGSNSRLASAVRIARDVASKLTPKHRSSYLATPHARLLLSESSSSQT